MAVRAIRAEQETRVINDFLLNDLLAQAGASNQSRSDTKPDPHLEVRTALDRAAARVAGRFGTQPLLEASIRQTIGIAYEDLGLYPEAESQLERALELRRRVLGLRHPDTVVDMGGLAYLYRLEGKYAQAEAAFTKVLEIERRMLGKDHPSTLICMSDQAELYESEGKYPQSEALFTKVLDARRRVLGPQHPDTTESLALLAWVRILQHNYGAAEPLAREALAAYQKTASDDWRRYDAESVLGASLAGQHKYAEAEPLLVSGYEG